ncbi:MAG TPA: hypothetical protein VKY74_16790 [Chloroflexia bacterium]|nr:hypothetical protein [Chloroflexia bacterium]
MNIGRVLGGALRLLRQRRVLALGMFLALIGLVYAAIHIGLQTYNPRYLTDLGDTLSTDLPPAFPAWIGGAAVLLVLGGLLGEGGLILEAGRRVARAPAAEGPAPARSALGRLPQLVLAGLLVWWPVLVGVGLALSPLLYWLANGQEQSQDWGLAILGSGCCAGLVFLAGWLLLWPLQRLANCAVLLEGQAPRAAVRTARRLFFGQFSAVFGLWAALLLLNLGLLVLSVVLAALAAALVTGLWTLLTDLPEQPALILTGGVAVLLGGGLLIWDGAVTAFNLNTWVLAYLDLRAGALMLADPQAALGTTQILGRQRPADW